MRFETPEELKVTLSVPASAKAWHDRKQQAFLEAQAEKHLEAQTEEHDEAQAEQYDEAQSEIYDEAQAEKYDEELESDMETIYAVCTGTSSFVNGVLVTVPRDPKEVAEEIRQAIEAYNKENPGLTISNTLVQYPCRTTSEQYKRLR